METNEQEANGLARVHASRPVERLTFNLDESMRLAEVLSKSALLPDSLRGKPGDVLVVLMTGHELGLSPMQSIRSIHVIKGKPVLSADLMVALCVARPDVCEYFKCIDDESDNTRATFVTLRRGSTPTTLAFTMEDAKRAELVGNPTWKKYPAAMLRARCAAALARLVYPDLMGGIYESSEAADLRRDEPTVKPEAVDAEFTEATAAPAETTEPKPAAKPPPKAKPQPKPMVESAAKQLVGAVVSDEIARRRGELWKQAKAKGLDGPAFRAWATRLIGEERGGSTANWNEPELKVLEAAAKVGDWDTGADIPF